MSAVRHWVVGSGVDGGAEDRSSFSYFLHAPADFPLAEGVTARDALRARLIEMSYVFDN